MSDVYRIGLISDTHGLLRNEVYAAFEAVDEILHAGDVGDPAILTELEIIAPVRAVSGNVDGWEIRQAVPEEQEIERQGHIVAVVHGHQWGSPKVRDLAEAYPDYSVVVYGHTHIPLIEKTGGPLVVNPGSAGHQRFNKPVTAAILSLQRDRPPTAQLINLLA
jgi:putative phosphoesterase